ncbi:MAG: hypothetical protein M3O15_13810 [Acidobacteriota bacterium]|nr:hypothetical protein [Acidobacteriota bacterium]
MSLPSTNFLLAITTAEGGTYAAAYDRSDHWSAFDQVTPLSGNNLLVAAWQSAAATVDDASPANLRLSAETAGGWSGPVTVTTGVGIASFDKNAVPLLFTGTPAFLLGAGGSTQPGWAFSLPLYQVDIKTGSSTSVGDLTHPSFQMKPGALDPMDPPVAISLASVRGTLGALDIRLCLASASGGLYYLSLDHASGGSFVDVKAGAGDPGNVTSVSAATGTAGLHVCVVGQVVDGGTTRYPILHTVLHPDGTWARWGDVEKAAGGGADFAQVAVAHFATEYSDGQIRDEALHLAAITAPGGDLLYTRREGERSPDPVWQPFVSVGSKTGGLPGTPTSVDLHATDAWIPA